jgi:hypothetical protein
MLNGASLHRLWESLGPVECVERLGSLLQTRQVRPEDFSLRELAEAFCGHDWVRRLNPRNQDRYSHLHLKEAGEGVDVTAFGNITGQIVYSKIHQGWDEADQGVDDIFDTVPTMFDGEKVPGIGQIKGEGEAIRPGQPYPETGFSEQYFETPSTTKHGMIVSILKETIFFDRTSQVTKRAGEVGKRLKTNKNVRCWACVAGVTVPIGNESFNGNNHKWKGTTYNTYDTSANAIGINSKASTPLVDYTSVEQAWLLFQDLKDPDTNRPILIKPDVLVVMPNKYMTATRIVSATEIRTNYPDYQASSVAAPGNVQFLSGNVLPNLKVIYSPLLYQVITDSGVSASNAKEWWFLMQAKRSFEYRENWPMTVVQSPPNSIKEFEQDIVLRWKASERGAPWVSDPRYTSKMYNS